MKLKVLAHNLRDAINKVLSVVDKRNSRPILTNTLITARNQTLEVMATDMEVSVRVIIDAEVESEGSFCINSKNIADILRELPAAELTLSISNDKILNLNCKKINYSLMIIESDDFPQISFQNQESEFVLTSAQLLQIINKTSHAISNDETRIYLNGIYLQTNDNSLRAVAIDGHKLALLDTLEFNGASKYLNDGIIIPRKGVMELKKIAEAFPDEKVTISIDESFIYAKACDQYFLSIRLIARDYPKYQNVIPTKTSYRFSIDRDMVLNAVKRVKVLSNEKTNGIKLGIRENQLSISTTHPALGEAVETLDISYNGRDTEIGFNAKYLLESLSVLNETNISFEFNNELSPVVIKSNDLPEYLGIIMPLKL